MFVQFLLLVSAQGLVEIQGQPTSYSSTSGTDEPASKGSGDGPSVGVITGIVVGVLLVAVLVIGLIWFFCKTSVSRRCNSKTAKTSTTNESKLSMPCGYDTATGKQVCFANAKQNPENLVAIDQLSETQKQELSLDCIKHGYWDDMVCEGQIITKTQAIEHVKRKTLIGSDLIRLTMLGLGHIYEGFQPIDSEHYVLPKLVESRNVTNIKSDTTLPQCEEKSQDTTLDTFTVYNHLDKQVSIYYQNLSGRFTYFCDIHADSRLEAIKPDVSGQLWQARASTANNAQILSAYMAYPGCTTWDIVSFETDKFIPSASNARTPNVNVSNRQNTYVDIYWVLSDGRLYLVGTLHPGEESAISPIFVGWSFVALQGDTVLSEYIRYDTPDTSWIIDSNVSTGREEIYVSGNNGYIFYQVTKPQDNTVTPAPKCFKKTLTVLDNTELLYASLFDLDDVYFIVPKGVSVSIQSTDASGTTNYNTNVNTANLYIEMTPDRSSLHKLCVKNPIAGKWTINISAMTNTPLCFQFQTVPTSDPYITMKNTLSPSNVLGSGWKDSAYSGFANIARTASSFVSSDYEESQEGIEELFAGALIPLAIFAVIALSALNIYEANSTLASVNKCDGSVAESTCVISDASTPPPKALKKILLVDANGEDKVTKKTYEARKANLYPFVKSGTFKNNYSTLVGKDNATETKLAAALVEANMIYVSASGHGNNNRLCGYTASGNSPFTPILTTNGVNADPALARGKIFHFLACRAAVGLGKALVDNGATAYIGYNETFEFPNNWQVKRTCLGDIEIDKALLNGKTIAEAKQQGYAAFSQEMNGETMGPSAIGCLKHNRDCMDIQGNTTARITPI